MTCKDVVSSSEDILCRVTCKDVVSSSEDILCRVTCKDATMHICSFTSLHNIRTISAFIRLG